MSVSWKWWTLEPTNCSSADYGHGTEPLCAQTPPLEQERPAATREAGGLSARAGETAVRDPHRTPAPRPRGRPLCPQYFRGDGGRKPGGSGYAPCPPVMAGRRQGRPGKPERAQVRDEHGGGREAPRRRCPGGAGRRGPAQPPPGSVCILHPRSRPASADAGWTRVSRHKLGRREGPALTSRIQALKGLCQEPAFSRCR